MQQGNVSSNQVRAGNKQGDGVAFQMYAGPAPVAGNIAVYDADGNLVDSGAVPTEGQTPWLSDIDGAGFDLLDAGGIAIGVAALSGPAPLEIANSAGAECILLETGGTQQNIEIQFDSGGGGQDWYLGYGESGAAYGADQIYLRLGPAIYFSINQTGQVGIRQTSQAFPLDVGGDVNISAGSVYRIGGVPLNLAGSPPGGPAQSVQWNDSGVFGGDAYLVWDDADTELQISSPGLSGAEAPGVYITAPAQAKTGSLFVNQTGTQLVANTGIYINGPEQIEFLADNGPINLEAGATVGPAFQFTTAFMSTALLIMPDSKVSIGLSTPPAYQLDVAGDVNIPLGSIYRINGVPIDITGQLQTPWLSDIQGAGFKLIDPSRVIIANTTDDGLSELQVWDSTGQTNVRIGGPTDAACFDLASVPGSHTAFASWNSFYNGSAWAQRNPAYESWQQNVLLSTDNASGFWRILHFPLSSTTPTEYFRIASNGFVGLSNSSPQVMLDVNGNIRGGLNQIEIPVSGCFAANAWWNGSSWIYRSGGAAILIGSAADGSGSTIRTAPTGSANAIASTSVALQFRDNNSLYIASTAGVEIQDHLLVDSYISTGNTGYAMNAVWVQAIGGWVYPLPGVAMLISGSSGAVTLQTAPAAGAGSQINWTSRIVFNNDGTTTIPGLTVDVPVPKTLQQTFITSGTFTPSAGLLAAGGCVQYFIVGGGGGGSGYLGGGGGGGGVAQGWTQVGGPVPVTIGGGGPGGPSNNQGQLGGTSSFGSFSATGGSGGIPENASYLGGYGGGSGGPNPSGGGACAPGTVGTFAGAGGGGAGGPGMWVWYADLSVDAGWYGGSGGPGLNGYAGGGGGGSVYAPGQGSNGGGNGGGGPQQVGPANGVANSGGGGGGAGIGASPSGGTGGSGIVILVWQE